MISIPVKWPQPPEEGRYPALLLAVALIVAGVAALGFHAANSQAAGASLIGIDMTPGASGTSSASPPDTCTQVQAGDKFDADVYVANVDTLTAWELRVDYNPAVVSIDSADYNFLLVRSGGQVFPTEFEQEKPGRMFLAAANAHSTDGGSGTLARLHLTALAKGSSNLQIATSPTYYGPRLIGTGGAPVGDTNADGYWDGGVSGGAIAVGQSCAPSTPGVTPSPPTAATATPGPGSSPVPGSSGGGPTDNGQSTPVPGDGGASEPQVLNPGSTGDAATGGGPNLASSPGADNVNSGPRSGQQPGDGAVSGTAAPQDSGGGGATTILLIAALGAALAIVAGGVILVLRRPHGS